MNWRYIGWILPVLLLSVFLAWGCSNAREGEVFAQPLTLATPASAPADGVAGMALPQQIVVVVVTPTAEEATSQQDQGQQNQGNQSDAGQAVAQAQTTPQPQEGGNAQGESAEGEQEPQEGNGQTEGEQTGGGETGGSQAGDQDLINMGEQIYTSNCASCHQPNGEGTSAYPALAGSQTLTGDDPASAVEIVVHGRGQMPAFGDSLSTEEIAAVISYERNSWGNSAGVVTADQVSQFQGGGGAQAEGEGGQEQGAPPPEAQAEQSGGTGETQATPAPEATPAEQTGDAAGAVSQVSVSQEQGTMVITIRIEIVVATPEAGAASPAQGSQPASGTEPATPAPPAEAPAEAASPTPAEPDAEAESGGEAAAAEAQATPAPADAQPQEAPTPEDAEAQATPAAEDEGAAEGTAGEQGGEGAGVAAAGEGASAAPAGDQELLRMGESLYGTTCANCHQLSGEGNTAYPSLVNNEIVIAEDPSAALSTILNGRGHMPAFAGMLSDQEIAAVLSHERNAWDNRASVVTAEQVAQVRGGGE